MYVYHGNYFSHRIWPTGPTKCNTDPIKRTYSLKPTAQFTYYWSRLEIFLPQMPA